VSGLTDDDARRLFARSRVATLATTDERGRARLVPICFALDGDTIWSVVDDKPKRSRRLRRLDDVARSAGVTLLANNWDDEDWTQLWWVRVEGAARLVDAGRELARAVDLLAAKYRQYREARPAGPALAVAIERISGWTGAGT
jgi:PPOX class probable F420-dependent enzyme